MIPINELKAPAVGCGWHEVAALVLDAATGLGEQPASDLSDLAAIELAADGYVVLPRGPESPWPVVPLAVLLEALLQDMPAPEALRGIAKRYQATPADDARLEAFVAELSRFERPDRTAVLSQLAARAASVDRSIDGSAALAHLASRIRAEEEAGRTTVRSPATPRHSRRSALAIGTAVVVASTAALVTLAWVVAPPSPTGTAPRSAAARVQAGAAALVASATDAFRPAPLPPEPAAAAAPVTPETARRTAPTPSTHRVPAPDGVVSVRWIEGHVVAPEPEVRATPAAPPSDPVVYTSADAEVTPATLLRPHLPSRPPASVADEEVGVLELMVTEAGTVAHVRLLSTSNRYQERMLVAAAKTWRFQPAMKNGRPVRFRARVRITV